jgi:hypothetical protein
MTCDGASAVTPSARLQGEGETGGRETGLGHVGVRVTHESMDGRGRVTQEQLPRMPRPNNFEIGLEPDLPAEHIILHGFEVFFQAPVNLD